MENFYDIDHPVLGILGGLGPAASCYFYQMVTEHTQAVRDQDHIDLVLSSRATTPDRTEFILGKCRTDPFAIMERDAQMLVRYGATVIAIPCNTAHYFFDRLAASLPVPVLHMPRLTVQQAIAGGCRKLNTINTTLAENRQGFFCAFSSLHAKFTRPVMTEQAAAKTCLTARSVQVYDERSKNGAK